MGKLHVWNQYVVRMPNRDEIKKRLDEKGVPTILYYPSTIPQQPVLRGLCPELGWPQAERAAQTGLALPVFPEMTVEEQSYVIDTLKSVF